MKKYLYILVFAGISLFFLNNASYAQNKQDNWYIRYKLLTPIQSGVYADVSAITHSGAGWSRDFGYLPRSGPGYSWKWLKPGIYSHWLTIQKNFLNPGVPSTMLITVNSSNPVKNIKVEVQVASQPDKKNIISSREMDSDGNLVAFLLPPNLKSGERLITVPEMIKIHLETAKKLFSSSAPSISGMEIATGLGGYKSEFNSLNLLKDELKTLQWYGFNSIPPIYGKYASDRGFKYTNLAIWVPYNDVWDNKFKEEIKNQIDDIYKQYTTQIKGNFTLTKICLDDEPGIADFKEDDQAMEQAFRAYLKNKGLQPSFFGLDKWSDVQFVPDKAKIKEIGLLYNKKMENAARMLYYYSCKFKSYSTCLAWKEATDEINRIFPSSVKTFVNPSDHPMLGVWGGSGMLSGGQVDWFEIGRMRATTMPWSEDWFGNKGFGIATMEFVGYIDDVLRAEAKYYNEPVGMYLVPVWTSRYFPMRQKIFTALGRGLKNIYFFDYGPTFAATENYFSENIPALKSIGQSTRQISKFNNILKTMKLLPAKVAIIWPISTEIWSDNEGTYNSEREMVWLALDRNQVPVDFLTEKDIEDGYLSHYDVLYGIGDYLNDKAAKNIKSWVEKGGILWAEPGFATKNEYDKSANILGISDIFSSVKSSDKFKEISPGKGKIYVLSSFPGLDYNKSSNRTQNNGYSTQFSKKIADFILTPIEKSVWKPHVQIGLDGIEASLLQNKNYYILFLVNYRKDPKGGKINSLNVEVNQIGKISSVVSADRGNINFTQSGKSIKFSLPLNTVDMIFLKKFYAGQEK